MDEIDIRYEEGKIYLVKCKYDDELVYVGSTIRKLEDRLISHKSDNTCSLYNLVDGDWDNWYIELYEDYPCKNKYELKRREGDVQREIANINKNIAGRTKNEYMKQYRHYNKKNILDHMKQYYHDNRVKILEQQKKHYKDNKEDICEKRKEKTTCDRCGSILRKYDIAKHYRTQKCINHKKCV